MDQFLDHLFYGTDQLYGQVILETNCNFNGTSCTVKVLVYKYCNKIFSNSGGVYYMYTYSTVKYTKLLVNLVHAGRKLPCSILVEESLPAAFVTMHV